MKPKDDLFKLIKSLSKSEKRYFTLDAKKSGSKSSQYLKLFQAINSMAVYDESQLPKGFSNLSVGKAYLYEAILKSMRDYRSPKSKSAQLKQRINDAKFLYERGLYDQCGERLRSAKALAEELADSLSLLEINREERKLAKEIKISYFADRFEQFKEEKRDGIRDVTEEFDFLDILDSMVLEISSKFRYSSKEDIEDFKKRIKRETWKIPEGFQGKIRYFQANAFYFHLIRESEKASEYLKKSVEYWDKFPGAKREEYFRYIKALANAVGFSFFAGRIELVGQFLQKLDDEKKGNFHEENLKFRTLISHRINFLIESGKFQRASELEKEVEEGLLIYDLRKSTKLSIWVQAAMMMTLAEQSVNAKNWLEKIINFKDVGVRRDIQKGARVLNLLFSAKDDEYEVTDNLIRSAARFFRLRFEPVDVLFESAVITFLRAEIPFTGERKQRQRFLDFYKKIPPTMKPMSVVNYSEHG